MTARYRWAIVVGGLDVSSSTRPRRKTYTGAVDVATTQQPKFAEVKGDTYDQLADLVIRSPEHGDRGTRRHLLSGSASESDPGRPPLLVRRRRRKGERLGAGHQHEAPQDPSTTTSLKGRGMHEDQAKPDSAVPGFVCSYS